MTVKSCSALKMKGILFYLLLIFVDSYILGDRKFACILKSFFHPSEKNNKVNF